VRESFEKKKERSSYFFSQYGCEEKRATPSLVQIFFPQN